MGSLNTPFGGPRDEAEYLRQEQQRIKEMRANAFSDGFEAGAAWATAHGIQAMARVFEKTADSWNGFPPASMTELAPEIEKTIIAGTRKAREEAAAAR